MTVQPIPEGYHTITSYLVVKDAHKLVDFLKKAFDATDVHEMCMKDGMIMHAELQIGDSKLMLAEARDEVPVATATLYLYVKDADHVYHKALKAGGVSIMEPADQFYGDRNAGVRDFAGNSWWIGTHIEDVPHDEIMKRAEKYKGKC